MWHNLWFWAVGINLLIKSQNRFNWMVERLRADWMHTIRKYLLRKLGNSFSNSSIGLPKAWGYLCNRKIILKWIIYGICARRFPNSICVDMRSIMAMHNEHFWCKNRKFNFKNESAPIIFFIILLTRIHHVGSQWSIFWMVTCL